MGAAHRLGGGALGQLQTYWALQAALHLELTARSALPPGHQAGNSNWHKPKLLLPPKPALPQSCRSQHLTILSSQGLKSIILVFPYSSFLHTSYPTHLLILLASPVDVPRIQPCGEASTTPWPRATPSTPGTSATSSGISPPALAHNCLLFLQAEQPMLQRGTLLKAPTMPRENVNIPTPGQGWSPHLPPTPTLPLLHASPDLPSPAFAPRALALWFPLLEAPSPGHPQASVLSLPCSLRSHHLIDAAFLDHPKENKSQGVFQPCMS